MFRLREAAALSATRSRRCGLSGNVAGSFDEVTLPNTGGGVNFNPGLFGTLTGGMTLLLVYPNCPAQRFCTPPSVAEAGRAVQYAEVKPRRRDRRWGTNSVGCAHVLSAGSRRRR